MEVKEGTVFTQWCTRALPSSSLDAIRAHTYRSGGSSICDRILNPWWEGVVSVLPLSLSPNSITLIGLVITAIPLLLSSAGVFAFGDMATPPWANLLVAACVFAYQTLDAIDGKQARRTWSSSPLGALFDHGCDAVACPLIAYQLAAALGYEPAHSALGTVFLVVNVLAFFVAQWEEFITKTLNTNVGGVGVTEAQILVIAAHVALALTPPSLLSGAWLVLPFDLPPVLGGGSSVSATRAFLLASMATTAILSTSMLLRTLCARRSGGGLWSLGFLAPLLSSVALGACVVEAAPRWTSGGGIWGWWLVLLFYCISQTHVSTMAIVFSMAHQRFPPWLFSSSLLPAFLVLERLFAISVDGSDAESQSVAPLVHTRIVPVLLCALLAFQAISYANFVYLAIFEISGALGIRTFHVRSPEEIKLWKERAQSDATKQAAASGEGGIAGRSDLGGGKFKATATENGAGAAALAPHKESVAAAQRKAKARSASPKQGRNKTT